MLTVPLLAAAAAVVACGLLAWLLSGFLRTSAVLSPIPSPPPLHWLLGHPGVIDGERAPFHLHDLAKRFGKIFRLRMAHLHFVFCIDPAEAQRLLSRGEEYLDKSEQCYRAFNWIHSDYNLRNILSLQTDNAWRAIRRATAACFTSAHLKSALPVMLEALDPVTQQLEAAGPTKPFNINSIAKRFTLDVIADWGFDTKLKATHNLDKDHEVVAMVNRLSHAVHVVAMDPSWQLKRFTKPVREGLKAAKEYDAWFANLAQGLQARAESLSPGSLGAALLGVRDPAFVGGKLSADELKTNTAVLMTGGYETTANTITIILLLLANYPEWLERIEAELDSAGLLRTPTKRQPRSLTWAALGTLPVINAVIKETLRLMPAAAFGTFRETTKETQICGYRVPAGVVVGFSPYAIDHSVLVYGEDAEDFRPDRWLAKDASHCSEDGTGAQEYQMHATQPIGKAAAAATQGVDKGTAAAATQPVTKAVAMQGMAKAAAAAVPAASAVTNGHIKEPMAFSYGSRDCVGQSLARLELQVFLIALLSKFRLHLALGTGSPQAVRASIIFHLTFTTPQGLWMTAEAR